MSELTTIAGWIGTALILGAYYLVSTNKLGGTDARYQLMNAFGALGVGLNVFYQHAWPALALQIVWLGIAVTGILKARR